MSPTSTGERRRGASRTSIDRLLDCLRHPRRRQVIYCLERTEPAEIEGLADRLATTAARSRPELCHSDERKEILVGLYHTHLPVLREAGLIEYDRRSGVLRLSELPAGFRTILGAVREVDDVAEAAIPTSEHG